MTFIIIALSIKTLSAEGYYMTFSISSLKVGLHYGNYRSKLVPFEEQKNILYILKRLQLRAIIAIV